jgi:hypothetical protein
MVTLRGVRRQSLRRRGRQRAFRLTFTTHCNIFGRRDMMGRPKTNPAAGPPRKRAFFRVDGLVRVRTSLFLRKCTFRVDEIADARVPCTSPKALMTARRAERIRRETPCERSNGHDAERPPATNETRSVLRDATPKAATGHAAQCDHQEARPLGARFMARNRRRRRGRRRC